MAWSLPGLEALMFRLKGKTLISLLRKAQRQTLLEWRDRTAAPGLAARFTTGGEKFYAYGQRWGAYWRKKGSLPDFWKTGRLRDMNLKRSPRSVNGTGATVITRMKLGGGVLNNLVSVGGITGMQRIVQRAPVVVSPYSYTHHRSGTAVSVAQTTQMRTTNKLVVQRSSRSMAEEFIDTVRDRPWIERRCDQVIGQMLRALIRQLATGGRRSKFGAAARDAIGDDDAG
jgi:hypothetical protein